MTVAFIIQNPLDEKNVLERLKCRSVTELECFLWAALTKAHGGTIGPEITQKTPQLEKLDVTHLNSELVLKT